MKKRIGFLKGKPVVLSTPNLVKDNEILYKQSQEGIVLQERKKNGNLENITVGGSDYSDSEILYYKFVNSDKTFDANPSYTYGNLASLYFEQILPYLNIISFKSKEEGYSGLDIGRLPYITGSQQYTTSDRTSNYLVQAIQTDNLLGFRLLKSKTYNINQQYHQQYESIEGTFLDKVMYRLFGTMPKDIPEDATEEELETIQLFKDIFNECFVQISKQQYDLL